MLLAKDLVKKYGKLTAVDGVSLGIAKGETFGLLGPNGAGKTTTISMLVGLLSPDSGSVEIGSGDQGTGSPDDSGLRRLIGVAPQSLSLYEELTAKENLQFFAKLYGISGKQLRERTEWALEFSKLEDRQNARVDTFSGGMKRRLNIAVALIHEPEILLLDEPTVGVDPQSRNHIFERIEELQAKGMSILYTTHYMEEAQRLCDRVGIMDKGKILALDSVDGLISKYGGKSVVSAKVDPQTDPRLLPCQLEGGSIRFESDRPLDDMTALRDKGVRFETMQVTKSDLESVFLELTGRSLRD